MGHIGNQTSLAASDGTPYRVVIATGNPQKLPELRSYLSRWTNLTTSCFEEDLELPRENGDSYADNALLKARFASRTLRLPALADDTGLEVDALGSRPGLHSGRWAGPNRNFKKGFARIAHLMGTEEIPWDPPPCARLVCTVALVVSEGVEYVETGVLEGVLTPTSGKDGYGYEPWFIPRGYKSTLSDLPRWLRQLVCHRAKAFDALAKTPAPDLVFGAFNDSGALIRRGPSADIDSDPQRADGSVLTRPTKDSS